MITPIRALSINDICKRENDLLVSADDIKELAKNERNKAIDEFAEKLSDECFEQSMTVVFENRVKADVLTLDGLTEIIFEIAQQLKAGDTDGNSTTDT